MDIWRERHPDAVGHYSQWGSVFVVRLANPHTPPTLPRTAYYGFRGNCRAKGMGWRLDSFIVPKRIASQVEACEIRHTIYGASDHVPIYLDVRGTL